MNKVNKAVSGFRIARGDLGKKLVGETGLVTSGMSSRILSK